MLGNNGLARVFARHAEVTVFLSTLTAAGYNDDDDDGRKYNVLRCAGKAWIS